jgi:hypothetical protein
MKVVVKSVIGGEKHESVSTHPAQPNAAAEVNVINGLFSTAVNLALHSGKTIDTISVTVKR